MAAGGHFEKKYTKKKLREMARNTIESDFQSSKMAQKGLPKWRPAALLKKNSNKKELRIDLKW